MPVAVITETDEPQRFDLKSCEGGYVVLKPMTFGQATERRAMTKLSLDLGKKGRKGEDAKGELNLSSTAITAFEFRHCIVEHNLCQADGQTLLNFRNQNDINALHPKIGGEINDLISSINNFEDDEGE